MLKATAFLLDGILYDSQATKSAIQSLLNRTTIPWFFVPLTVVNKIEQRCYKTRVPPTLISACRLTKTKNIASVISAVKILHDRGLKINYNIVGSGTEENELVNLVKNLGLSDSVKFTGYLSAWIEECYKADIFIQASRYEGLCISIIEAMSTGIPTISTNVGEIVNYGNDGINMLKTNGFEPVDFADKIQLLISDETLRRKIGLQGQKDMLENFSNEKMQEHYDIVKTKLFATTVK